MSTNFEFKRLRPFLGFCSLLLMFMCVLPRAALADGPITPAATDYQAKVISSPPGTTVRPVDGYLSLWLRADPGTTVIVRDYRGAPFIRFGRDGVFVNHNSQEYYLNQVPVPAVPPKGLSAHTPPAWFKVSSGRSYAWREGRLHALATIAIAPSQSFVGNWQIPVSVNGRAGRIYGAMFHRSAPSPVWFWPILVMLLCAAAAWRIRSAELDRKIAKRLTLTLMALFLVAVASRQLHARPVLDAGQLIVLGLVAAAVAAAIVRVAGQPRPGLAMLIATVVLSGWAGVTLLPVLTHGYVLVAFPPLLVRSVTAALLGGSLSLLLVTVRLLDLSQANPPADTAQDPVAA